MTRSDMDDAWLELLPTSRRTVRSLQHTVSMAPQLATSQREQIHAMLLRELPHNKIAETVGCSERAVRRIRCCGFSGGQC
jgi:uncharacterized protein YerC